MFERIGYRPAVMRQPDSLEASRVAVTESLDALDLRPLAGRSLGLVGIGASLQAAIAGSASLRRRGVRAQPFSPSELFEPTAAGAEAYLALSASGRSIETATAMERHAHVPRIAVCREADNPLAAITGGVIAMRTGADAGPSSTGYNGTIQALGLFADRLVSGRPSTDWTALPEAVARVLASAAEPAKRAAELLSGRSAIDLVGAAGVGFATAGEAALLVREAARVPAAGFDTLNYLHGPMECLDGRTGLVILGAGREVKLAQDVAALGCPTLLITERSDVAATERLAVIAAPAFGHDLADAILQILPVHLLVAELADATGLTDVTFRYRQTDTKIT